MHQRAHYATETFLNDMLEAVSCLVPYLRDILVRLCTGKIAVVGGIKQAFLQIGMNKIDLNPA